MNKAKALLTTSTIVCLCSLITGVGFTFAKFTVAAQFEQTITSKGKAKTSIFLDPFIWEKADPLYVMYAIDTANETPNPNIFIYPTKKIDVTVNGIVYPLRVFEFDDTKYNQFKFVRANPSVFDEDAGHWNSWAWNETFNIPFYSNKNLYQINQWKAQDEYPNNSGCYVSRYYINSSGNPAFDTSSAYQWNG